MADTEGTSSSIPSTSNPSNNRRGRGRGGSSKPSGRQEGLPFVENQNAPPAVNTRGGQRAPRGGNRGRGGSRGGFVGMPPNVQPAMNFVFNPYALSFNPSHADGPVVEHIPMWHPSQNPVPPNQNVRQPNQDVRRNNQNPRNRGGENRQQPRENPPSKSGNQRPNNRTQNQRRRADEQNQQGPPDRQQRPSNHRGENRGRGGNRGQQGRRQREPREEPLTEEESRMLADKPLRERLIWQLENSKYECAICYRQVTPRQGVWSCKTCYHIFHISNGCITDWAKSSRDKEGANTWRCPTCQTENVTMPYSYFCFCGRQQNPTFKVGETPHGCGEICGRSRKHGCPHPCTELCHPGPCVECPFYITKACNCGRTKKSVRCGSSNEVQCDAVCGKQLSCENHDCQKICHSGECGPCTVSAEQDCFCGKNVRELECFPGISQKYACGVECDGVFDCGVHNCNRKCHSNGCGECERAVSKIKTCPCGRHSLESLGATRKKCTDEVATCNSICDKWLSCGPPGKNHRCQKKCHEGPCPPCTSITAVACRCGNFKGDVPCDEYLEVMLTSNEYLCTRRCRKKKSCGMHKCQEVCCIQDEHFCAQACNKRLSCGMHTCENVCHAGLCRPCLNASFDEQFCHCGTSVRMPPIPCGARLPVCSQPCARPHNCNHTINHKCHGEPNCPPCIQLTDKVCYGGHTVRKNIPCHMESVSCGVICQKPLKCGVHVCQRSCHGDECEKEGEKCIKKCEVIRAQCEHPCALPCHGDSPCEPSSCKTNVKVTCECGRIKKELPCYEVEKMILARLEKEEEKRREAEGPYADESKLKRSASMSQLNCFKCDDECKKLERNRKVAEALEVDIDEFGMNKLAPTISFPCYLKEMVKTNIEFVKSVEKVFCDLIIQVFGDEAYSDVFRQHMPPMSIEKRRFIHEYAHFFNITSESVDSPPKRSIELTAVRGKSHQPLVLISDLVNFKGALKTPGPAVIRKDLLDKAISKKEEEEGLMKPLRCTEKMVVRREARPAKEIAAPIPIQQQNQFTLLGSDVDSDAEEGTSKVQPSASDSPPSKDWWDDEAPEAGWKKIQQKEYTVEVEREMTEEEIEVARGKEEGPTWEDAVDEESSKADEQSFTAVEAESEVQLEKTDTPGDEITR